MKKSVFAIILVLLFALTACSNQNTMQDTSNTSTDSLITLDEGV